MAGSYGERAHLRTALARILHRDDVDRDVTRLGGALENIQQAPAVHVGQPDIQGDHCRVEAPHQRQCAAARRRRQGQLFRLFFQLFLGTFDFLILRLHLLVLPGQQVGFLDQFLVLAAQLLLLRAQQVLGALQGGGLLLKTIVGVLELILLALQFASQ